jgi:hypothetical protein
MGRSMCPGWPLQCQEVLRHVAHLEGEGVSGFQGKQRGFGGGTGQPGMIQASDRVGLHESVSCIRRS